ncbi:zinc finger MYM-type protein 1-like [Monomorium pharaonis]|uniref:zinc finger MYM-type protein 1-like n=1 Tax=Monomorium pharaonis TaxID=307658 RepID=UPI0017461839|nr:zinc finger MYM-type protein 1-like [Monomorium pharaonis]
MSQVIRYVDKECNIRESFIDFIDTVDKTGEGLAQVILEKLKHDGLEIENCRGQAYDNGANMVGKYKGVQSHILSIEKSAKFMPCAAHKLNLVGVHAASVSVEMNAISSIRNRGIESMKQKAASICVHCDIDPKFKEVCLRKKKQLSGELASDETLDKERKIQQQMFLICDRLLMELHDRFLATTDIMDMFNILSDKILTMTDDDITQKSITLVKEFPKDFDADELTTPRSPLPDQRLHQVQSRVEVIQFNDSKLGPRVHDPETGYNELERAR